MADYDIQSKDSKVFLHQNSFHANFISVSNISSLQEKVGWELFSGK